MISGYRKLFRKVISKKWTIIAMLCLTVPFFAHSQVLINEFLADNNAGLADPDFNKHGDWIELYNTGGSAVDLSGMYLTDDELELTKWMFPSGTEISGGGFLLVWADNDDVGLHTNFRLSNTGEFVALCSASGQILDSKSFEAQYQDVSYGRSPDGSNQWSYFSVPTPGKSNSSGGGSEITPPPAFSHTRGFYPGGFQLTLTSSSPSNVIRFTSDGSNPDNNSQRYSSPIQISSTTVIRAVQYQDGQTESPVATHTYLVNESTILPVFSITTDPENLWDEQNGIYVKGPNYTWGWGNGNFWQDWEKPCYVEMFESDHTVKINQSAALKITGALTRTASQKSLRIIAKGTEYGEPKFDYRLFKDKEIKNFNDIVLRSSGNDWAATMMADGLMQTIVANQMDIDWQAYRPAILFLNGEYWGIHNIREKIGDDYIEENHDFDKDNIDLISQMDDVREGDFSAYSELLEYVRSNDMSIPSNFEFARERIDIQEYINYNVAQIFFANHDWPAGNIKFWRPRIPGGVWRWILFDLDLAFKSFWLNTLEWATMENPPEYPGSTDLFKGLMKNAEFSAQFLVTIQKHLNSTFDADRVNHIIDSLQANIQPEMNRHINRWMGYHGWTWEGEPYGYIETGWLESYDKWLQNVDVFRRFADGRHEFLLDFIRDFYQFDVPVDLEFVVSPPGSGRITVNNALVVTDEEDATYFSDQDLTIQATPLPLNRFVRYEITNNPYEVGDVVQLIPKSAHWKYNDSGAFPGSQWNQPGFNKASWSEGCAVLGYNDPDVCTTVSYGGDTSNKYITTYFVTEFNITSRNQWSKLTMELRRDDGAIVYLNGIEVIRSNMNPGIVGNSTLAASGVDGIDEQQYYVSEVPVSYLVDGLNVVAVEVHQNDPASSDLVFDLAVSAEVGVAHSDVITEVGSELIRRFDQTTRITAVFDAGGDVPVLSVNEVQPVNVSTHADRLGSYSDWIEIYNPGNEAIDIAGLYITDNELNPGKWCISNQNPAVTTIAPKDFLILYADNRAFLGPDHLGFKLTGEGEMVGLTIQTSGGFIWIDSLHYPAMFPNYSMGRFPDGTSNWYIFEYSPTPGNANQIKDDPDPGLDIVFSQNYPNPFSEQTYIDLQVKNETMLEFFIRDLNGTIIRIVENKRFDKGIYKLKWDGRNGEGRKMPPGLYLFTIISETYFGTKKMILLY